MDVSRSLDNDPATTPKPHQTFFAPQPASSYPSDDQPDLTTPTRDTFHMAAGPYPPPPDPSPMRAPQNPRKGPIGRSASLKSGGSGDQTTGGEDGEDDVSDEDSANGDADRPQKKKKGQRFFCTDFPPCNLSFTRSEHLARHIRKHTGERPFQCHCLRRFSRLDNLRQHAQTVHLNEDIPTDSLAATGTRFQRQIRTDRVRSSGARARSSTLGSQGSSYQRGHARNFSGSSIGSVSDFGSPEDARIRQHQPPLAMAQTTPTRNGLSVDTFGANAASPDHPYYPYYTQSNNGYSSPTPVFSADPNSPVAHAGSQSPITMAHPRGMTWAQPMMHSRRMSVPAGSAAFQTHSSYSTMSSYMSPPASSNASTFSNASSMVTSPTSSVFADPHHDHATEAELRRRTWHPGTYGVYGPRPATSGLSYYQTPDAPKPVPTTQSAAQQNVRLPGIDSFVSATHKPAAPPFRALSPMEVDSSPRRSLDEPERSGTQNLREQVRPRSMHMATKSAPQSLENAVRDMNAPAVPLPVTPRRQKREAWYNGPLPKDNPALRTSPGGSSSGDGPQTPSAASAEYHPAIVHSNGFVDPIQHDEPNKIQDVMGGHSMAPPQEHFSTRRNGDMDRLDALVAVATSESQAVDRH